MSYLRIAIKKLVCDREYMRIICGGEHNLELLAISDW